MKSIFLLFLSVLSAATSAQKIDLEGIYQGRNIYIQNPFASKGNGYCTDSVRVNGTKISLRNSSTYEIKLDSLGLMNGDKIKLEIFHKANCHPRVISDHSSPKILFEIVSISVDSSGMLNWTTKNEVNKLPFIVEQYRWNKWMKVAEVNGKGDSAENSYSVQIPLHSEKNQLRIKQTAADVPYLSKTCEVTIPDQGIKITGKSKKQWEVIQFSGKTLYELYDKDGNVVKKGEGVNIEIKGLERGTYYLNYDNKTELITIDMY